MALTRNTNLVTPSKVAKEALLQFVNNLILSNKLDWSYSAEFQKESMKGGESLTIKKPIATTVYKNGFTYVATAPYEPKSVLTIDQDRHVYLNFMDTDIALAVDMDMFAENFIKRMVTSLANDIDAYVFETVVKNSFWSVGQYGTAIGSDTILAAKEILQSVGCPDDGDIFTVLNANQNRALANSQLTYMNPTSMISEIYKSGLVGQFAGTEIYVANTAPTHIDGSVWNAGTRMQTAINTGALSATNGNSVVWAESITITADKATASKTISAGDVFYLSGTAGTLNAVNPGSKNVLPIAQKFVVLTAVDSTTAVGQTLVISPAIITSGAYQNVESVTGLYDLVPYTSGTNTRGQEGVMLHKKSVVIGTPKLYIPQGLDAASGKAAARAEDDITGAKIRYLRVFDFNSTDLKNRIDTIFGVKVIAPEWIVRIR